MQIASVRCNQHRSAGVSPSPLANNQHELPPIQNVVRVLLFVGSHLCIAAGILHNVSLPVQRHPPLYSRHPQAQDWRGVEHELQTLRTD
jgi:hypothetical protein